MRQSGSPRVVLSDAERHRIRQDLETIGARLQAVEEGLQIAAWRSGTNTSDWTQHRLDVIRETAGQLVTAIDAAPSDGD